MSTPTATLHDLGVDPWEEVTPLIARKLATGEETLDIDTFAPPRQDWLDGTDTYLREPAEGS